MSGRIDYDAKNPVATAILRESGHGGRPPREVLSDRDQRELAPQTPNTALLGDPPTPRWNSNAHRHYRRSFFGLGAYGVIAIAIVTGLFTSPAHAARHYWRHASYANVSGDCWTAARLGGPCGCTAMKHLGLTDRRFWLVRNWYVFPRTSCHPGAAALWGTRHVEAVTSCEGNTATTNGPYGIRRTPVARLHFVDPHGASTSFAARTDHRHAYRVASHRHPRYARYAQLDYYAWRRSTRFASDADSWQPPHWR